MGLVYKGRHESLDRAAAIKTLLPKDAADASLRQRLLREAQAQASLQHPNIVTVYDLIDEQNELFIAMEYVEGETLAMRLERRPNDLMTLEEALPLFEQILDALEYVHGENIIHRDVKPSNVMVCGSQVKLTDFGIALLAETPRLTTSRRLIGTPPYMSPEQLEGNSIDPRSDQYSSAIVLYRMLTGRAPFDAEEHLARILERVAGPPDLRALLPTLPTGVADALLIALRYDRNRRFQSVAAFRDALHEGAVGFRVNPPNDDEPTEPVDADATPEQVQNIAPPWPHGSAVSIGLTGTFLAAALAIVTQQKDRPSLPVAPPRKTTLVTAITPPVILEPAAPQRERPRQERPAEARRKADPFATSPRGPVEDPEAKHLRDLLALREAITRGLAHAEEALGQEQFDAALGDLDHSAELAQRDPENLGPERGQIALLRTRVVEAQVEARTNVAVSAQWEARLADIEDDLRAERWPEAERFAAGVLKDPRAPESIAARALALLQRAKDGRKDAFKDTQLGPTNNAVRKPSSPPRKDL